ncbi:cap-specific mRNA (nucleoside-2'-O-)-methyltransferase 2 isoform X2 [Aethina tumida]|uniref:cap-specific mRNA (nucleoside-2'-O-)-methyltransferase 2 isoform X2 n=1 Tax=Aethina tumida TaxID=116153 RepID=UPI00214764FE|nr:cap-specific mRNA (nucleoside-2'-O-)-methyltransferase 2 isoform X2 [Aethina tumida]
MHKNEVKQLFNKSYHFKKKEDWILPQEVFNFPKWKIPGLQSSKEELNYIKGLLNGVNLEEWSYHTKSRDPSSFVIQRLKQNIHPELLTQAWCKFYECVNKFPIVPQYAINLNIVNTLHICEAPGGFICSLNHYLKSNFPALNWIANTLNPNYEGNPVSDMINDDRLIRFTLNNWCFGKDNTGDIKEYENFLDITTKINNIKKRDLVTADGSVDCMQDPGNQESHVAHLHYCETMIALSVLETGGTFIIKIFTMFEESTISLLYLLNCAFESVTVHKPCCSKSGNSEVYIICTIFKGIESLSKIWDQLLFPYRTGDILNFSMFKLENIPHTFLLQIEECSEYYKQLQITTIMNNIYHFNNKVPDNKMHYLKFNVAQKFINKFKVKKIRQECKIVPGTNINRLWRNYNGFDSNPLYFTTETLLEFSSEEVKFVKGKRFAQVQTSKFAPKEIINSLRNKSSFESSNTLLYVLSLQSLKMLYNVYDLQMYSLDDFSDFQKKLINSIECDRNIIFLNIPFVTHFLVGILYNLMKGFRHVYFCQNVLILYQIRSDTIMSVKTFLANVNKIETDTSETILEVVPSNVFDKNPLFLKLVLHYNNNIQIK